MLGELWQPVLADGGGFSALVFLILMFLGWLLNMANAKNQPQGRGPQRQPQRPGGPRNVDEVFAQLRRRAARDMQRQQGRPGPGRPGQGGPGQGGPGPRARRPQPVRPDANEIEEFVDVRERPARPQPRPRRPQQVPRQPQPAQRRPQPRPRPQSQQAAELPRERRAPGRTPPRPSDSEMPTGAEARAEGRVKLGETLQSHVSEYMNEDRIEQSVASHLKRAVGSISSDAAAKPGAEPAEVVSGDGAEARELLRSSARIRQAILINEILQKPLGLRR